LNFDIICSRLIFGLVIDAMLLLLFDAGVTVSPKFVFDTFFAGQASLPEGKAEAATTPSAHAAADAGRDAITTPASTST
jgi:nitrogen fixation protein FixH